MTFAPSYFDARYARDADPWRFATSEYEKAKYDAMLDALPARHFTSGFEAGCSIGVLTRRLAQRCTALLAADFADAALAQARLRCADLPNVQLRRTHIPQEWPEQTFDLIVLSEILYYLTPAEITATARRACGSLSRRGIVLLVNYTLPTDSPVSGDEAAEAFIRATQLLPTLQQRQAQYRLDLLQF